MPGSAPDLRLRSSTPTSSSSARAAPACSPRCTRTTPIRALHHHRGEGPARQVRLHAHGAGRLQRGARRGRLGRAPLHGHDRGRQVAARPGPRLDAGHARGRAHPRARERARLLLRPQSRRHASTRRRSPARPSTAPCTRATSPASRSSTASPSRCGRGTSIGSKNTARSSS